MQQPLPLPSRLASLAERPFTVAMAQQMGINQQQLRSAIRRGQIRNLVRGVYASVHVGDDVELRCAAVKVALAAQPEALVFGQTAAWLYGVLPGSPAAGVSWTRSGGGYAPRDVRELFGVKVTTPLRTAIDLADKLPKDHAVALWDAFFREHGVTRGQVLSELPRFNRGQMAATLRSCLVLTDGRSESFAESLLRLSWLRGPLPTPTPGLVHRVGQMRIRIALGLAEQEYGVTLSGASQPAEIAALRGAGWGVVELGARQVEVAKPETLTRMLVGEYHRTLLARVTRGSA